MSTWDDGDQRVGIRQTCRDQCRVCLGAFGIGDAKVPSGVRSPSPPDSGPTQGSSRLSAQGLIGRTNTSRDAVEHQLRGNLEDGRSFFFILLVLLDPERFHRPQAIRQQRRAPIRGHSPADVESTPRHANRALRKLIGQQDGQIEFVVAQHFNSARRVDPFPASFFNLGKFNRPVYKRRPGQHRRYQRPMNSRDVRIRIQRPQCP